MNLVRVDDITINLDLVTTIKHAGGTLYVHFPVTHGSEPDYETFTGKGAEALSRHLNLCTTDLNVITEDDDAYRDYRERGGEMSRHEWEPLWHSHLDCIRANKLSPYEGVLAL